MALIRWEPARELNALQGEMNRLFSTFFDAPAAGTPDGPGAPRRWIPAMDLVETDDHFVLRADLPGVAETDVELSLEENVLTVSGERHAEQEVRRDGFHRIERASGTFRRSLTLPEGVDGDAISASFDRGVLEVRIPKPAERKPRRLQIQVGDAPTPIEGRAAEQAATS
ncbi:Hsp20/alpha crystallin family protein [Baekduia soli]|uniref:Hsp20/alpha crystallin family protein n=1 Tax=Baekduia soli TaxID=496014 RepID=A0A5B8U4B4_9ACTN|nr:Hsp20/alpha crystallin family protein [Baekduia soli]QEC47880.1 Hsp20/alpha crystallin family protein [Baekduia soli]